MKIPTTLLPLGWQHCRFGALCSLQRPLHLAVLVLLGTAFLTAHRLTRWLA